MHVRTLSVRVMLVLAVVLLNRAEARAAETASSTEQRLRALEAEVLALKKKVAPPSTEPGPDAPLAVREPPFGHLDSTWMNGTNRQPSSLLGLGPVDFSFYVDSYYLFQFHAPKDHTAFLSTTAPRHNEISLNLASMGIELSRLSLGKGGGPIGRFFVQYGASTETNGGLDQTTQRGFFLTNRAFQFIREAAAGWHFNVLHGINVEIGIFPSYVAMESYLPQENWNYLHPFVSDFTPYYFSGSRTQIYPRRDLRLELWAVNGWQTYGQWHEGRGGGYLLNWRPYDDLSLTHAVYAGQDLRGDAGSVRFYADNYVQARLYKGGDNAVVRSLALALVADYGYETRSSGAGGHIAGFSLSLRAEWTAKWATTLRGDVFYDERQALVTPLPTGEGLRPGRFLAGGGTITFDYLPSPWLLLRFEYMHRESNIPYFSGPNGLSGLGGPTTSDLRTRDDRVVFNTTLRL